MLGELFEDSSSLQDASVACPLNDQAMAIGHADSADNGTNDTDKSLVGTAQEKIRKVCGAVKLFVWCTIDGAVIVPRESSDRFWGENIGVDHVSSEIGHETDR